MQQKNFEKPHNNIGNCLIPIQKSIQNNNINHSTRNQNDIPTSNQFQVTPIKQNQNNTNIYSQQNQQRPITNNNTRPKLNLGYQVQNNENPASILNNQQNYHYDSRNPSMNNINNNQTNLNNTAQINQGPRIPLRIPENSNNANHEVIKKNTLNNPKKK